MKKAKYVKPSTYIVDSCMSWYCLNTSRTLYDSGGSVCGCRSLPVTFNENDEFCGRRFV